MEFENKVVLITGASKGLGKTIAKDFAKNGATVIINYNKSYEEAKKLKREIDEKYQECEIIKADVSSEEEVKNMIEKIVEKYNKIDIVINNAGIAKDNLFEFKTKKEFTEVLNTNLIGPFLTSKYVEKYMSDNSSIINISSDNALYGYIESIDYDASKAGLISLTKNLAKKFAPKTRVNCICPGWIDTSMNENLSQEMIKKEADKILLKRFGNPEEIANVALFLASDKASYVNGSVIVVNGGRNE